MPHARGKTFPSRVRRDVRRGTHLTLFAICAHSTFWRSERTRNAICARRYVTVLSC